MAPVRLRRAHRRRARGPRRRCVPVRGRACPGSIHGRGRRLLHGHRSEYLRRSRGHDGVWVFRVSPRSGLADSHSGAALLVGRRPRRLGSLHGGSRRWSDRCPDGVVRMAIRPPSLGSCGGNHGGLSLSSRPRGADWVGPTRGSAHDAVRRRWPRRLRARLSPAWDCCRRDLRDRIPGQGERTPACARASPGWPRPECAWDVARSGGRGNAPLGHGGYELVVRALGSGARAPLPLLPGPSSPSQSGGRCSALEGSRPVGGPAASDSPR